ncbi:MAG: hypothetical protein EA370_10100 [Wenzhouxiangella sp.]|nr:MAG: hypothetical protein EA370_10100 [Wenzhouxiangella sp.]
MKMTNVYPTHHENPLLYAGFWKRFVAYMVDGIIRAFLTFAIILIAAYLDDRSGFLDPAADYEMGAVGGMGMLIVVLMYLLYHPLFEASRHQATPGKMLLGIIVTDTVGQRLSFAHALGRHLAGAISYLTSFLLYFGYWMAGITARKQALHDLIANCLVINRNAEVKLPADVRYVAGGFPLWAGILIGLVFLIPVLGILAAITVPAYMNYVARATVAATISETATTRQLIVEQTRRQGFVPASHHALESDWPQSINEGKALVEIVDGTLRITFTERAPARLQGTTIGMALHGNVKGQTDWQCGLGPGQGPRLSRHSGAELTTVEEQLLPTQCR